MFQLNLNSADTVVLVDGSTGRPREIKTRGKRLSVSALESVRDETAAYPLGTGPRTVFVVRAGGRRYRLVHLIRDRRWILDELEVRTNGFSTAA